MADAGPLTLPWRPVADGISIAVKVQPKARRPGLQGTMPAADGTRLRIGVGEAAEGGKANRAACAILARALGVSSSAVTVVIGASNREKVIHVSGDPEALMARLVSL
jgi:uncharacterized protein YggU (UPF0235/DUF167 family)